MKILHTADWHLGKIVHYVHMTDDQKHILKQFIETVRRERPDVIIIAGDLYDRSIPPKQAIHLLNDTLTTLISDFNIPVLAISGNHDSPDRLQFGAELFKRQGLYLETKLKKERMPVTLYDEHGPVHFHLIPYVEPAEVAYIFDDPEIKSHQQAAEKIIDDIKDRFSMDERHVWIGHAFLAGGMETDSEERLSMIGGSPYIDAHLFSDFDYVALGHLHQPQKVSRDHIRYSGSILKYSFSESNHKKSVTCLELDASGLSSLEKLPLIPLHDFEIIEGMFDELLLGKSAANPENYLHIQLLDDGQLIDPMNKLRKVYPNILYLERKSHGIKSDFTQLEKAKERQKKSHDELFISFYENIKGKSISEKRKDIILQAIQTIHEQERGK